MATSPFTKIPTEMVSAITSFLSVQDLQNFRLVSRWAQHESFSDFANRRLATSVMPEVTGNSMFRRAKLVEESPHLASAVKELEVRFYSLSNSAWKQDLKKAARNSGGRDSKQFLSGRTKEPTLLRIASMLPHLVRLELLFLDGPWLRLHILPRPRNYTASASAWSHLQHLKVSNSRLGSTEWKELLGTLIGLRLRTLHLSTVCSTEGGWSAVFDTMQRLLNVPKAALTLNELNIRVHHSALSQYSRARLKFAHNDSGVCEQIGFPADSDAMRVGRTEAVMEGPKGISKGLDAIKQYLLATYQEY
ncbi:hypothetical protein LTR17_016694 [Elasticomyces elasticus]|nr:hypothetical protein LTR17_016694 [Elasticomyces elasticus]